MFGSSEALEKVVADSVEVNITYAGIPVLLRMLGKDDAAKRMGGGNEDGQEYGLQDVINDSDPTAKINMIDMGGNYGAVSIAVFKKFRGKVRAVVLEPVPHTYFFLRWNLWQNGVPDLDKDTFVRNVGETAVIALHRGVTEASGDVLSMCASDDASMNARSTTDAKAQGATDACDCSVMQCNQTPGISTLELLDEYFPNQEITLLKMDCEGCEYHALPALSKMKNSSRVRRLVGELHLPEERLIDVACKYDNGVYMTKVCRVAHDSWQANLQLDCHPGRKVCKW